MGKRSPGSKGRKKNKGGSAGRRPSAATSVSRGRDDPRKTLSQTAYLLGILALAVSAASSLVLAISSISGLSAPGCGPASACAELANGPWGKVPGIGWPVSFVGSAYFLGALAAWLLSRAGVAAAFRALVRLGALLSVMFVIVMIAKGQFCLYCVAAHAGNLLFWLIVERSGRQPSSASWRPVIATALVFVAASAALGVIQTRERDRVDTELGRQTAEDVRKGIERQKRQASTAEPSGSEAVATPSETAPAYRGFRGRYLLGPEKAPIRIVMISDYQCKDCRAVEAVARQIMQQRDDVSLSIKHYPMSTDCNYRFKEQGRNLHPNACVAARAAEAAGRLGGDDGYFQMHSWLFDRQAHFAWPDIRAAAAQFGFDPDQFVRTMQDPAIDELIQQDIREAVGVGLNSTPMVFINGDEIRGLYERSASKLLWAVNQVAAQDFPAATHENDRAPTAAEKCVEDWRRFPQWIKLDPKNWGRGPFDAKVQIVLWGDYQRPRSVKADRIIRGWMAGRDDVRYVHRHFPFHRECNSLLGTEQNFPLSCFTARAAEAAGLLGGNDAFWVMHDWLMDNSEAFANKAFACVQQKTGVRLQQDMKVYAPENVRAALNECARNELRSQVVAQAFDPAAFFAAMTGPQVDAGLQDDLALGREKLAKTGLPTVNVDRRLVARWDIEGERVLERILTAAAGETWKEDR